MGDQLESISLEFDALRHADGAEARDDGLVGDASEIEALATGVNGFRDLLRVGGREDEHHVIRGLLKRLEQRVEGRDREHVNLVDDVDLVATARRGELHAPDDLLAHVLDAGAGRRVELIDIRMLPRRDELAVLARAVRIGGRTVFA